MGFFGNLFDALWKPKLADPVPGTAQVVSSSMPPYKSGGGGGGMCVMNLVITVPGQPSVAVRKANIVRLAQWPMPGTTLPIVAERSEPRKFHILWDQVTSGAERGAERAEQIAERINAGGRGAEAGAAPSTAFFGMPASVTINGQPATAEALAAFEAMTGMDLNGDGAVGAPAAQARDDAAAPDGADRLRRLQALRDDGLISEAEYQAKRAEILGKL